MGAEKGSLALRHARRRTRGLVWLSPHHRTSECAASTTSRSVLAVTLSPSSDTSLRFLLSGSPLTPWCCCHLCMHLFMKKRWKYGKEVEIWVDGRGMSVSGGVTMSLFGPHGRATSQEAGGVTMSLFGPHGRATSQEAVGGGDVVVRPARSCDIVCGQRAKLGGVLEKGSKGV